MISQIVCSATLAYSVPDLLGRYIDDPIAALKAKNIEPALLRNPKHYASHRVVNTALSMLIEQAGFNILNDMMRTQRLSLLNHDLIQAIAASDHVVFGLSAASAPLAAMQNLLTFQVEHQPRGHIARIHAHTHSSIKPTALTYALEALFAHRLALLVHVACEHQTRPVLNYGLKLAEGAVDLNQMDAIFDAQGKLGQDGTYVDVSERALNGAPSPRIIELCQSQAPYDINFDGMSDLAVITRLRTFYRDHAHLAVIADTEIEALFQHSLPLSQIKTTLKRHKRTMSKMHLSARHDRAADLARDGMSLNEIAERLQFSDGSSLSRSYKQSRGVNISMAMRTPE